MNQTISINGKEIEIIDISKFNIDDVSEYDKKEVKILLDNLETIKEKEPKLYVDDHRVIGNEKYVKVDENKWVMMKDST